MIEFLPKDENLPQVKVGRIIKLEEKFPNWPEGYKKIFKLASPIFPARISVEDPENLGGMG